MTELPTLKLYYKTLYAITIMIMTTMTADEVEAHMKQDFRELQPQIRNIKKEWKKYVNNHVGLRLPFNKVYRIYNNNTRQEYIIVMMWLPSVRRYDTCTFMAVVKDARQTYYVRKKSFTDAQICAFSHHFFMRYGERTGINTKDLDTLISFYSIRNFIEQAIYKDDWEKPTRSVYANKSGIMLAKVTPNHWCIYATFVSTKMLKDTQVDARDEIKMLLDDAKSYYELVLSQFDDTSQFEGVWSKATECRSKAASEIYSKFWEDEN